MAFPALASTPTFVRNVCSKILTLPETCASLSALMRILTKNRSNVFAPTVTFPSEVADSITNSETLRPAVISGLLISIIVEPPIFSSGICCGYVPDKVRGVEPLA